MSSNDELNPLLTHMRDEIIALQIKVAALEEIVLDDRQREMYEKLLKEQTERMMQLRGIETDDKPN